MSERDREARLWLFLECESLAAWVAIRTPLRGLPSEDAKQIALLALWETTVTWNPALGWFAHHVSYQVWYALKNRHRTIRDVPAWPLLPTDAVARSDPSDPIRDRYCLADVEALLRQDDYPEPARGIFCDYYGLFGRPRQRTTVIARQRQIEPCKVSYHVATIRKRLAARIARHRATEGTRHFVELNLAV